MNKTFFSAAGVFLAISWTVAAGCGGDDDGSESGGKGGENAGGAQQGGNGQGAQNEGGKGNGGENEGGNGTGGEGGTKNPCEAAALHAASLCSEEDQANRKCIFEAYAAELCETERAEAITAAMECFTTDECHTFADPGESDVEDCLSGVYEDHGTAAADVAATAYCTKCSASVPACGEEFPEFEVRMIFQHLTDAQNTTISECIAEAQDCTETDLCVLEGFPPASECSQAK